MPIRGPFALPSRPEPQVQRGRRPRRPKVLAAVAAVLTVALVGVALAWVFPVRTPASELTAEEAAVIAARDFTEAWVNTTWEPDDRVQWSERALEGNDWQARNMVVMYGGWFTGGDIRDDTVVSSTRSGRRTTVVVSVATDALQIHNRWGDVIGSYDGGVGQVSVVLVRTPMGWKVVTVGHAE